MAKPHNKPSPQTVADAEAAAKATQKPGQSKQQTKLIAQGIQKGIEHYKKQQKAKARELDRKLKNLSSKQKNPPNTADPVKANAKIPAERQWLPWVLLIVSWLAFIGYSTFAQS